MITFLKSIMFASLLGLVTVYYSLFALLEKLRKLFFPHKNYDKKIHELATKWAHTLFKLTPGWSMQLIGIELLPPEGTRCVIVANHESATDILALYYLKRQFRWLSKEENFKVPLIGWGMTAAGYIPIKRGNKESSRRALELCKEKIKRNIPVLFFPEGTRSTLGHPKTFKPGAFKIAQEMNVPILPIVLKGAGKLLNKGSMAPNKATITVKILEMIQPEENETLSDFTLRVEKLMCQEHQKLD